MRNQFVLLVALLATVVVGCDEREANACDRIGVASGFVLGTNQVVAQRFAPAAVFQQQAIPAFQTGLSFGVGVRNVNSFAVRRQVCGPFGNVCLSSRVLAPRVVGRSAFISPFGVRSFGVRNFGVRNFGVRGFGVRSLDVRGFGVRGFGLSAGCL